MSATPAGSVGVYAEDAMAEWLRRLSQRKEPWPNTATYNAAYEAVVDMLTRRLPRDAR